MRLWSIHPKYLDSKGLVACWREGLLAQKVLLGETKGYKNHPQLQRFNTERSLQLIGNYLNYIFNEACIREYKFDNSKIISKFVPLKIKVTRGQLEYEFKHLQNKLKIRAPRKFWYNEGITVITREEGSIRELLDIEPHPLFKVVKGEVEPWEKISTMQS